MNSLFPELLYLVFDSLKQYSDLHLASQVCKTWTEQSKKIIAKRVEEEIRQKYVCDRLCIASDASKAMKLCLLSDRLLMCTNIRRDNMLNPLFTDSSIDHSLWCMKKTSFLCETRRRSGKTTMIVWLNILIRVLQPDKSNTLIITNGDIEIFRLHTYDLICNYVEPACDPSKWVGHYPYGNQFKGLNVPSSILEGSYIMTYLEYITMEKGKTVEEGPPEKRRKVENNNNKTEGVQSVNPLPDLIFIDDVCDIPPDIFMWWVNRGIRVYWFRCPIDYDDFDEQQIRDYVYTFDKTREWDNQNVKYVDLHNDY